MPLRISITSLALMRAGVGDRKATAPMSLVVLPVTDRR
jgi:hypothetical protein